ncbi:eukaryotic translation initiation factor 2D isoform X2 [Daktulosphaira vitifoliae]|uniref:eukaryotic translation initiation factor 2D isoform X2 n=1 Tax=Daktulosphaira vitifoliae TaxID=58002 RepID=UPI0021AA9CC2|nr:eukaryotic translation initiation factor 2D isoform X2 [Daktulosphaira vitifoliae]
MFQKEFRIKSNVSLKGTELKKLKTQILKSLNVQETMLDDLLSKQISLFKIITHNNNIIKLFCIQDVAALFEFKGKLYPSLYMVWKFPQIIPTLKINENTKPNLNIQNELKVNNIKSVDNIKILSFLPSESCVSVYSTYGKKIVGIGYITFDGNTINELEESSKCLNILHHCDDFLFKLYVQKIIPDTIKIMEEQFKSTFNISENLTNVPESNKSLTENMDDLMLECSLKALKNSITKDMLPLLASTFYKKYVMPLSPKDLEIDIKKTSYKKLSSFLQILDKDGIIKFQVEKDGIAVITHINFNNDKLLNIDSLSKESSNDYLPPVKETYIVTSGLLPLFSEFLCRKGDELSVASIRRYITEYVKKYELQDISDPSMIKPNEVLQKILSQRKDKLYISFKDLNEEIIKLMHHTEISTLNTDTKKALKKKLNTIDITVNNRSGNKKVTLVNNLEMYGIDLVKFSKECQHGVAASTTINNVPNAQNRQVQIQGCQVLFVFKLLTETIT